MEENKERRLRVPKLIRAVMGFSGPCGSGAKTCVWGGWGGGGVPEAHALFPTCPGGVLDIVTLG